MASTRILVVFTGGTIGSRIADDLIDVVSGQTYRLLNDFLSSTPSSVEFDVVEPVNILSENARPRDWTAMATAILAAASDEHTGVIVTHGTDTLSYSAAALAFALAGLPIPVVFVASDLPLEDPAANGPVNFRDAVDFIESYEAAGVFVAYCNPDGRRLVHLGSRVRPVSALDHYIHSVDSAHIAEFDAAGELHWASTRPQQHPLAVRNTAPSFSEDVLFVHPYPGLNYERINISGCAAVVHDLYHSGTATTDATAAQSIIGLGERCLDAKIPLFCASVPRLVGTYESSSAFVTAGITPVEQMLSEVAYVKATYGVGIGLQGGELRDFVCRDEVAGEFVC